MQAELAIPRRPVEADARTEIVDILVPGSVQERQQDGIDLAGVANVIHVGINLVAETQIEG